MPRTPSGLINVGNSCYLSSVLQFLAAAGEILINHFRFRFCDNPIASALSELLETINCGEVRRIAPISFIKSFAGTSMGLSPEQQDAHEFLLALLNMKSKELNLSDSIALEIPAATNKSIMTVSDPFIGVLMKELICLPCATKRKLRHISSLRIEPFSCITLTPMNIKISEAVYKHFCAPEKVSDYRNYKTKTNNESCGLGAVTQKRPLIFPQLLFLHVSLLTQNLLQKSQEIIETEIELSGPGYRYKLMSIIVHYGQSGLGGHFICYRRFGKKWFECNDENVKIVSEDLILGQRAYILLYERED